MKKTHIRLSICIPSTDIWLAEFGMDLAFLVAYLTSPLHDGMYTQLSIQNKRGSMLANMREQVVETAIEQDYEYVLFLDSDQTFPPDLFHRLYKHGKQVVGCNVATKQIPANPTARLKGDDYKGVPLYTGPDDEDLVPVWRLGTGIMLIKLNVFKRKGMEQPWFPQRWNEEQHGHVGEDWGFCEKLEASGVKIYVDQDLSREIGHIGKMEYKHRHVVKQDFLKDAV